MINRTIIFKEAFMNRLNKMTVFFLLVFVFSPLAAENISFTITKGAKLVLEDTYGKTHWDNLVDRGRMFYCEPLITIEGFADKIRFIKIPEMVKITLDVPLKNFFNTNSDLLVGGALYSTLKNGKQRKNYWIEGCFFYDTKNGEAGLRVLNYYRQKPGSIKRTYFVHWDLKKNVITGAVLLLEEKRIPHKGEYAYTGLSLREIGYNYHTKTYYYEITEADIQVKLKGKYRKYIHTRDDRFRFYGISGGKATPVVTVECGSWNSVGIYNPDLNMYFLPAYKDPGQVYDKKYPQGFLVDLTSGTYKKIAIQRHAYWCAFNPAKNMLYHVSSSSGKLWATDITTGKKTAALYLGDAGDDRYRKLALRDSGTLLFYLKGKLMVIDINNFSIRQTIDLPKQFSEFSASSPAYILPGGKGLIIEARTVHNKTTGFLYYLREK
jgi:hypothetical protein